MDINTLFTIEDREDFVNRIMLLIADIDNFGKEVEAGGQIIPQLDLVSLGEWIMLLEMVRWAAKQLAVSLDTVTTFAQTTIEEKTNAS